MSQYNEWNKSSKLHTPNVLLHFVRITFNYEYTCSPCTLYNNPAPWHIPNSNHNNNQKLLVNMTIRDVR